MRLDRRTLTGTAISVAAALALYSAFIAGGSVEPTLARMALLSPADWAIILGLSLVNYGARYLRWEGYVARLGHRLHPLRHLTIYVAGFAFTATPGKAGEGLRSVYLSDDGVPVSTSLAVFFVERAADLAVIVALAALVVFRFDGYGWLMVLPIAVLALAYAAVRRGWLERVPARSGASLVARTLSGTRALASSSAVLLHHRVLIGGIAIGLVAWAAEGLAFAHIARACGLELGTAVAIGVYSLSLLAGAVSMLPGGLGSAEAVMGGLLILLSADAPTAVAITLISRASTLWFAVGLGFIALTLLHRRGRDDRHAD